VLDPVAIRARLSDVRERIANAASRAGRDPASVRLVAVSKAFSSEHIRIAAAEGQVDFGENKVQEGLQKIAETAGLPLRWHLIGHLQSNKARKAAQHFHIIHSIDNVSLLSRIDEGARTANRTVDLLVQVDLANEPTKHGAVPDTLFQIFQAGRDYKAIHLRGLMLLPPFAEEPSLIRPYFSALRSLRDGLIDRGVDPACLSELSMGMSHDFEVAIEEGATVVRVGSAIFGSRVS
jgi:pyridoxal phosphate enzyme (YggS family)